MGSLTQFELLLPELRAYARSMRGEPTDAEALLWRLVRGKALGVRFRRQHPVDRFILDFYCPKARLAVELDGSQHAEEGRADYDAHRDRLLQDRGIRVLRFSNEEFLKNPESVLETVWETIQCAAESIDSDSD